MSISEHSASPLAVAPIGKTLAKFAVPAIISNLITSVYNIVDQIFIGQNVGILGNAATNVAFPISIICTAVAILFGFGGAARLNLEMGRGNREKGAPYCRYYFHLPADCRFDDFGSCRCFS